MERIERLNEVITIPKTLSPLRYPGGKSKLSPLVRYIIENDTNANITTYIEPFAGGAGIALDLLINGTVNDIIINDYNKPIYSFWKAIITEPDRFIKMIKQTPITIDEWRKQKEIYATLNKKYSFELGFATFFLNRTNRSGILSAGPIGGYDQTGNYLIDTRFNKENLAHKISTIAQYRKHIKVYNKDFRNLITQVIINNQNNSFVYFDPPYYVNGKKLYTNYFHNNDHIEMRDYIVQYLQCPWVITYDTEESISNIYSGYTQRLYNLPYSLANKGKSSELIIFSNERLCPSNSELINAGVKVNFHIP